MEATTIHQVKPAAADPPPGNDSEEGGAAAAVSLTVAAGWEEVVLLHGVVAPANLACGVYIVNTRLLGWSCPC